MTREEIKKRIEELKERRFYLAMKDRWTREDYQLDYELTEKINDLIMVLDK